MHQVCLFVYPGARGLCLLCPLLDPARLGCCTISSEVWGQVGRIPWSLPRSYMGHPRTRPSLDCANGLSYFLTLPSLSFSICKWQPHLSWGCWESPRRQGPKAAGRQGELVVWAGAWGPGFTLLTPPMEEQDLQAAGRLVQIQILRRSSKSPPEGH